MNRKILLSLGLAGLAPAALRAEEPKPQPAPAVKQPATVDAKVVQRARGGAGGTRAMDLDGVKSSAPAGIKGIQREASPWGREAIEPGKVGARAGMKAELKEKKADGVAIEPGKIDAPVNKAGLEQEGIHSVRRSAPAPRVAAPKPAP
jgi:hypothetical protein